MYCHFLVSIERLMITNVTGACFHGSKQPSEYSLGPKTKVALTLREVNFFFNFDQLYIK
jgi:hypothetical protein